MTLRWREPDSNHRSRCCKRLCWALPIGMAARSVEPPKVRSEIARIDLGGPPMAVPFAGGPMVRIRFPPPGSQQRTGSPRAYVGVIGGNARRQIMAAAD